MTISTCQKHNTTRDKNRHCKQCQLESQRIWTSKNREKVNFTNSKWKKENKKKVNEINREWAKKNRAIVDAYRSNWEDKTPYADCLVRRAICKLKSSVDLKLKSDDIPPEMIEIKRLQMQLHHAIKAAQ